MHSLVQQELAENPFFLVNRISFVAEIEKMGLSRSPVGGDGKASPAAEQYKILWQEISARGDGT